MPEENSGNDSGSIPEGKGLQENFIFRAVYTFCDETGEPALMLGSHVDDLIWACHPKYQYIIDDLKHFQCGKVEQKKFRYCGKEVAQDDDFTIHVVDLLGPTMYVM
jgi:hypothetical protein